MTRIDLNKRAFIPTENASNGIVDAQTIFTFTQSGKTFHAGYKGGDITNGYIIGKFTSQHTANLLYQCLTTSGELKAGKAIATFTQTNNCVSIDMKWQWLNGDGSAGTSHYIEMQNDV